MYIILLNFIRLFILFTDFVFVNVNLMIHLVYSCVQLIYYVASIVTDSAIHICIHHIYMAVHRYAYDDEFGVIVNL